MPLTASDLYSNYYLAIVAWLCGNAAPYSATDPSTGAEWAFTLFDDGSDAPAPAPAHPFPQIASWGVVGRAQPSDETLQLEEDMTYINAARAALYPSLAQAERKSEIVEDQKERFRAAKLPPDAEAQQRRIEELAEQVRELSARLASIESSGSSRSRS